MLKFYTRQTVEILIFCSIWQLMLFFFVGINNVLFAAVHDWPIFLNAFTRTIIMLLIASVILSYSRLYIFEYYFSNIDYVTPRKGGPSIHPLFDLRKLSVLLLWSVLGSFMLLQVGYLKFLILTPWDYLLLLILWIFTDLFFFLIHRAMHLKLFFRMFHMRHHRMLKPTAYEYCEDFTYLDGVLHIVEYVIAYNILKNIFLINNELWLLGLIQWYIIGQMQHGGKPIPQNQIPGLEIVRRWCGLYYTFCSQHDMHHTRIRCNYSMTGIYDKIFGTLISPKI